MRLTPTPLGRLIRERRAAMGLSLPALARAVGVTPVGIGDIERGKRFSLGEGYWPALASALGVDLEAVAAAVAADRVVVLAPARFSTDHQRRAAAALADLCESVHLLSDPEAAALAVAVSRLHVAGFPDTDRA